jgi:hypothetical protein
VPAIRTVCPVLGGGDHVVQLAGVDRVVTVDSIGQRLKYHRPGIILRCAVSRRS